MRDYITSDRPNHTFIGYNQADEPINWPLPNLWLGVTVENQEMADKRIPILLKIPTAVRFVNIEPMLGPVDLTEYLHPKTKTAFYNRNGVGKATEVVIRKECLNWVIVGGETGPGARPMHPEWVRSLRDQCVAAGVPFFFKSWGTYYPIYGFGQPRGDEDRLHAPFIWVSPNGEMFRSGAYPDALMLKLGKRAAHTVLDDREWQQFPKEMAKEVI